jgi:hypothetical protein
MCKLYTPIESLFLDWFISDFEDEDLMNKRGFIDVMTEDKEHEYNDKDLYDLYISFCRKRGFLNDKRVQKTITRFIAEMINDDVPLTNYKSGVMKTKFNPKKILEFLEKKKYVWSEFIENEEKEQQNEPVKINFDEDLEFDDLECEYSENE